MFDRLIDVVLQFVDLFKFWTVVDAFERAVVLRLGNFHRELGPGLHWILPFNIEVVLADNVVPRTVNMGCQSLVTHDGKSVVAAAIVTAKINDIRKANLEVENVGNALSDSCYATIGDMITAHTWEEIRNPEFTEAVFKACRKQAWKYGVEIIRVQFADLTLAKAYRILKEA